MNNNGDSDDDMQMQGENPDRVHPNPDPNPALQPRLQRIHRNRDTAVRYRTTGTQDIIPMTYRELTIDNLTHAERRSNKTFINLQLLRIVSSNGDNGRSQGNYSYYRRQSRETKQNASYTRMFLLRQHGADDVCYIIEDGSQKNLWHRHPEVRDSGILTIGTIITLFDPSPITSYIGNDTPIVSSGRSALVRSSPRAYLPVPITNVISNVTKAFTINDVSIRLDFVSVESSCSGFFCDRQNCKTVMTDNKKKCGCYVLQNRNANISFCFDLTFRSRTTQEELFSVTDFSSYQFMNRFLTSRLPSTVQLAQLQAHRSIDTIVDSVNDMITAINQDGGFTIFGWYKRGEINDQGITNEAESTNVQSGSVSFHVVHIIPTDSDAESHIEDLLIDYTRLV